MSHSSRGERDKLSRLSTNTNSPPLLIVKDKKSDAFGGQPRFLSKRGEVIWPSL